MNRNEDRSLWISVRRALRGRCPCCGRGRLFRSYLKPVASCEACGENWAELRADDGPAWLTILIVGHLLAPVIAAVAIDGRLSAYQAVFVIVGLGLALCLLVLPRAKAAFIAAIWALRSDTG
jgi:uncharacterized protein (DUF983 family)